MQVRGSRLEMVALHCLPVMLACGPDNVCRLGWQSPMLETSTTDPCASVIDLQAEI